MPILKKQFVSPILTAHPIFKGLAVSECVEGWNETGDVLAHSHVYPKDPFVGWICCKGLSCVADDQLLRHELAHLLNSYNHGHDKAWRDKVLELGGNLNEYTFRIGKVGYDVPCFTEACLRADGMVLEEKFPDGMEALEDAKYRRALLFHPTMLAERDRLIDTLNRIPLDDRIVDGTTYLREKLAKVETYVDFQSLLAEVTIPISAMY